MPDFNQFCQLWLARQETRRRTAHAPLEGHPR